MPREEEELLDDSVMSLDNEEDVAASQEAAQGQERRPFLKIPSKKTPWYLLSLTFSNGFRHWLDSASGRSSVTCLGDSKQDKGWAPGVCDLCAYTASLYQTAKELGEKRGAAPKKEARSVRAKFEAHFTAIRGERIAKEDRSGKRIYVADFDMGDDEGEVEVGILSLSQSQYLQLADMKDDDEYPFIKTGADLANRILWSEKKKRKGQTGGSDYTEVIWTPAKKQTARPDVDVTKEMEVTDDFLKDDQAVASAYALLTGEQSERVADDEEVELEEDSPESEDDDNLDDDFEETDDDYDAESEEEEEEEYDEEEDEGKEEEDILEDVDEDDDEDDDEDIEPQFEDDIPTVREKPARRGSTTRKSTTTRSRNVSSTKKKTGSAAPKTTKKAAPKSTAKSTTKSGTTAKKTGTKRPVGRPPGRPPAKKTTTAAKKTTGKKPVGRPPAKRTSANVKSTRTKSGKAKL